ncbi:FAD-dependent oxidoreductase [Paeniglutamicibacter sp. ABSL32-1]|uniref:FAD-dependent oxidoreductase n=1 Tax=Paeniglutamicibacter quisquiliarum TaxID=2849498 RepID=UPI001C2D03AF|nr:FAD-dependent oxidoreductase [Paeniglutamicibacter quisquiliarum]MBV1778002.1 FAD-dependent oxidoreductase [Paeniglutamicibacter quisquiliarum]
MEHELDLIVIGWGKGGKTLAGTMARAGQRVAIIEASPDMYGGTCINIGCVPTKALIHDADIRPGNGFDPDYFDAAVLRRDKLTAAMRAKNFSMLDGLDSVITITGRASFISPRRIRVEAGEETLELEAKRIIINTGAVPTIPDLDGARIGGRIHDSTTLQHAPLPKTLVVVGGGYVGTEFASMFAHFGSKVTVLDRGARALKKEDEDVAAEVLEALNDVGVEVRVGASVKRIGQDTDSALVHYDQDGQVRSIEADAVLIALGRTPATGGLNLESAGIELTASGAIKVDGRMATTAEGVYALGDVNGGPQFTYVSLDDNRVVADAILGTGKRTTADRVAVPHTIFTTPPLARVGLSEDQARAQGLEIKVAVKKVAEIAAMPRPKIVGDARGIVKIVVDADSDRILGAALMHVDSQEVINLVALAMRQGVTSSTLRDSIFTHPSSTEALNEVPGSFAR